MILYATLNYCICIIPNVTETGFEEVITFSRFDDSKWSVFFLPFRTVKEIVVKLGVFADLCAVSHIGWHHAFHLEVSAGDLDLLF